MKICLLTYLSPFYGEGGTQIRIRSIAQWLASHGHSVHIVSCRYGKVNARTSLSKSISLHYVNNRCCRTKYLGAFFSVNILKNLRQDIDVIDSSTLSLYPLLRTSSIPYVCTTGSWSRYLTDLLKAKDFFSILYDLPSLLIARKMYSASKRVVAIGEKVAHELITCFGVNKEKIDIVPNGVDVYHFNPSVDGSEVRSRYQIENDAPVLLYVGSLGEVKNPLLLLRVFKNVKREIKSGKLMVIGEGPLLPSLRDFVVKNSVEKDVIFTGKIAHSEIPKYYAASDILVLPSKKETFPLVILEALAHGKPVIASNVGLISEVIKDNVNGFLINPRNEEKLSKMLRMLLKDDEYRHKLGKNGRRLVEEHYSLDVVGQKLLGSYEKALELAQ